MAAAPALGREATSVELVLGHGSFDVSAQRRALGDIQHVEHRLLREEGEAADQLLFLGRHFHLAKRDLFLQRFLGAKQQRILLHQFIGLLLLEIFFQPLQPLFDLREIGNHQVELDVLDVAQRIDLADVGNGIVFKGTQHMDQRIDAAQVGEQAGFLERLLADGGDVGVLDCGEDGPLGVIEIRELLPGGRREPWRCRYALRARRLFPRPWRG